jgi:hypothetical protein
VCYQSAAFRVTPVNYAFDSYRFFRFVAHAIALIAVCLVAAPHARASITLTWNADTDPNTAGYIVYTGTVSGSYSQQVNVGNVTTTTVAGNLAAGNLFFAVAAYDTSNLESPPSIEVVATEADMPSALSEAGFPTYVENGAVVTGTAVTFSAVVNPNGAAGPVTDPSNVYVFWQYELAGVTQATPPQPIGTGTTGTLASYTLPTTGLSAAVYQYQLVISSTVGNTYGPAQTFSYAPPAVAYNAASISGTGAPLSVTVNPNGLETTVSIQYGSTSAYSGGTISAGDVGSGFEPVTVDPNITGLTPNTPYHYRVVTTNALGTFYGPDEMYVPAPFVTSLVMGLKTGAPGLAGATFLRPGNPAINDQDHTAFQAVVTGGGVTAANNSGIWADSGTNGLCLVARTGTPAPGYSGTSSVGTFFILSDPVYADDDAVAFMGTLATTGNVTATSKIGIWATTSGTLALVAREADPAPDPNGVVSQTGPEFSMFLQYVLPNQGGVIFLANLTLGVGGVGIANNQGIWAVGTDGVLRQIVRKGDTMTVNGATKTVIALSIFTPPAASMGQTRHFNNAGDLVYRVTFNDGSMFVAESVFP